MFLKKKLKYTFGQYCVSLCVQQNDSMTYIYTQIIIFFQIIIYFQIISIIGCYKILNIVL